MANPVGAIKTLSFLISLLIFIVVDHPLLQTFFLISVTSLSCVFPDSLIIYSPDEIPLSTL